MMPPLSSTSFASKAMPIAGTTLVRQSMRMTSGTENGRGMRSSAKARKASSCGQHVIMAKATIFFKFSKTCRPSRIAATSAPKLFTLITRSAASSAADVHVPRVIPIFEILSAGTSVECAPVTATMWPIRCACSTSFNLCWGWQRERMSCGNCVSFCSHHSSSSNSVFLSQTTTATLAELESRILAWPDFWMSRGFTLCSWARCSMRSASSSSSGCSSMSFSM